MVTFKSMSFPFRISRTTGGIETAEYTDDGKTDLIRQSLMQIVGTTLNERVIEKYFGTELINFNFDLNDEATSAVANQSVIKAITQFEPRVTIRELYINRDEDYGKLEVGVSYTINRTGIVDQFAFLLLGG